MTNSQLVEHTYKKHHSWLSAVSYNFTGDKSAAEELTQDLYLKLMEFKNVEKIMYGADVNLFYLYKMIRSIFVNKANKKINSEPIDEDMFEMADEEYSEENDTQFEAKLQRVQSVMEHDVEWFDRKLLQVYIDDNHSIRSLSEQTRISMSTVWTSLSKTKKYIKHKIENEVR